MSVMLWLGKFYLQVHSLNESLYKSNICRYPFCVDIHHERLDGEIKSVECRREEII